VCCLVWMNAARTAGATCMHFRYERSVLAHACPYSRDSNLRSSSQQLLWREERQKHFRRAQILLLKTVLLLLLPHTTAWQIPSACVLPESILSAPRLTNKHTHSHTHIHAHTDVHNTHTHSCDCHPTTTIFPSTSLVRMSRAIAVHVHTVREE